MKTHRQMRSRCAGSLAFLFLSLVGASTPGLANEAEPIRPDDDSARVRFFEREVRPLLAEHCHACHGPDKQKGSLRLDSLEAVLKGGESGPSVVQGKPEESLLVDAVNYNGPEMPPSGKLEPAQIDVLTRWVAAGAPWPATAKSPEPHGNAADKATANSPATELKDLWSLQPIRGAAEAWETGAIVPPAGDPWAQWAKSPIDGFILAGLFEKGLTPAPEAGRRALIRRLTFDLTGIPPTPAEVGAFLADPAPDAYERLVDRLLDSPRYGERWGRHWLDLVRYAESDGHRQDAYRPSAWRYRDYVVQSLNQDKPYDRFLTEQLAGDELNPQDLELRVATGFLRLGTYEYNQRNVSGQWSEILNDMTDVTGEAFLGLSIGCARCHDHKFDPIPRKDYYRLQAFFTPLLPRDDLPLATSTQRADFQGRQSTWEAATASLRSELATLEKSRRDSAAQGAIDKFPPEIQAVLHKADRERTPLEIQFAALAERQVVLERDKEPALKGAEETRREELRKRLAAFDHLKPAPLPEVMTVSDVGPISPATVIPGSHQGGAVEPGFLSALDPAPARIDSPPAKLAGRSTGRRLALARWLCRDDNPLTTRVIVNRVWQQHFGKGLVATSSDFGRLGQTPSHPELLDWLARRFVADGWRLKPLHRLIVTSAAYRQSAVRTESEIEAARKIDPDNRLLWKRTVTRLDAEEVRDALLAVSGELESIIGGPSVETARPRRAIDTQVIRNSRDPLLDIFDAPDTYSSAGRRNTTTTSTQALIMINSGWTLARARAFAARVERATEAPSTVPPIGSITTAFSLAYGRPPEPEERASAIGFLNSQSRRVQGPSQRREREALVDFCHALMNSNEFLYVD